MQSKFPTPSRTGVPTHWRSIPIFVVRYYRVQLSTFLLTFCTLLLHYTMITAICYKFCYISTVILLSLLFFIVVYWFVSCPFSPWLLSVLYSLLVILVCSRTLYKTLRIWCFALSNAQTFYTLVELPWPHIYIYIVNFQNAVDLLIMVKCQSHFLSKG